MNQDLDNDVRLALYRFFVDEGRAPVASDLAEPLSLAPDEVEASFRRMHDNHVLVLAPGTPYIWMANPFSALPTPYRVRSGQRSFWGNCIWDALGILALLGSDGVVESTCQDCGDGLSLEVRNGDLGITEGVVHYAVPAAHWWDDIGFN